MISRPTSAYHDAQRAVWHDVRLAALLAVIACLLAILKT